MRSTCPPGTKYKYSLVADDWYDPKACDSEYQDALEFSIANLLFIHCSSNCVYDLKDTSNVAYMVDVDDWSDSRCFQRLENPVHQCFHESLRTIWGPIKHRADQFCSSIGNTYEILINAIDNIASIIFLSGIF